MLLIVLPRMWLGFHTSALIAHIQLEISVLLSMQISYHALMICPFLYTFLEMGWRTSRVFGDLDPPPTGSAFGPQSMSASQPHSCTCFVLCCACLQNPEQGCLSQRSAVLPPYGPPLRSHPVLFHTV